MDDLPIQLMGSSASPDFYYPEVVQQMDFSASPDF